MDEPLLQCSGLRVGYAPARRGETSADGLFSGLDFSLVPGELVALMGENGCGKSTLLKTFAGLLSPLAGSVNLCGSPVAAWDARARAQKVALVRMSGSVPERMTVRDFVSMGRSPYSGLFDGRSAEDEKAIERAMDLTDVNRFANMWRVSDDFWDRWSPLYGMFGRLDKWTPYRIEGAYPDADMLPFGIIEFRRPTRFTHDEQVTVMSLWCIARSPLMLGADMTKMDDWTVKLLTNKELTNTCFQWSNKFSELSKALSLLDH